ncbi:MAG: hypothetical protein ACREDM_02885 [Methylocella sp.]
MTLNPKKKTAAEIRACTKELARRHRAQFEEWLKARAEEIARLRSLGLMP